MGREVIIRGEVIISDHAAERFIERRLIASERIKVPEAKACLRLLVKDRIYIADTSNDNAWRMLNRGLSILYNPRIRKVITVLPGPLFRRKTLEDLLYGKKRKRGYKKKHAKIRSGSSQSV